MTSSRRLLRKSSIISSNKSQRGSGLKLRKPKTATPKQLDKSTVAKVISKVKTNTRKQSINVNADKMNNRSCNSSVAKVNKGVLHNNLIIDSDDDDTYYIFASGKSEAELISFDVKHRSKSKPSSQFSHSCNARSSSKARRSITKHLPKVPKRTTIRKTYEQATTSLSSLSSSPLAVVCSTINFKDLNAMGPPPNPFLDIRNSYVRPVDRIPISPYNRSPYNGSPESAHCLKLSAHHNIQPSTAVIRRITRSFPQTTQSANETSPSVTSSEKGRVTPSSISSYYNRAVSPTISERRLSARQTENVFKYKHILVKKTATFTQVILHTQVGNQKNTLTVKALRELTAVLNNAKYDDASRVVLITGSDNGTFCSGLDLTYLTTGDIHLAARTMSDALVEFVRAALSFPKPLVAAVNGQAVGCGVALLPLCDVVYASDKATFFAPYTQLSQVPEAGLSYALSQVIGIALANEMLMAGRMLTALEAYQMGLVAQVFWPTSMMQEVIPRITNMALACSSRVLNATKSLISSQHRERMLAACHAEAAMQVEIWSTPECQRNMKGYVEHCLSI